jgi:hypothetical protein
MLAINSNGCKPGCLGKSLGATASLNISKRFAFFNPAYPSVNRFCMGFGENRNGLFVNARHAQRDN